MSLMTSPETGAFDRLARSLYRARGWLWLAFAAPAAVLAGLIMVVLPPQQELANIGDWAFRLSPIVLAVCAVSVLPRNRFGPALFFLAIVFYMGVLDTGLVERIQQFGKDIATDENAFEPVYQFELLVVSFVTVFALLAYRMGGARTAVVLKTGIAAVLVVISGLNDFTFWCIHTFSTGTKPTHFTWATHMIVFLGGPPTVLGAAIFVVVHLVLAVGVLCLPLARWVDRALAGGLREHD